MSGLRLLTLGRDRVLLSGGEALLVGCDDGLTARWLAAGLPPEGPLALLFTDGRPASVAGLYGLLAQLAAAGRRRDLLLVHALDEARVAPLVGAFLEAEGASFPVTLEAERPGELLSLGPFAVQLRPAKGGIAFRVHAGGGELEVGPHADG